MSSAVVVCLEEVRQARIQVETRRHLQEHFDQWLDALEEQMPKESPTLDQVTQAVFEMRQDLTGKIAQELIEQAHKGTIDQGVAPCLGCGRLLRARDPVGRSVETLVGEMRFSRPYFYCTSCQKGFYPLDEALEISQRRKQWDMQKAAASLAVEVPYETASELFGQLTGVSMSDHTAHEVVDVLGDGLSVLDVSPSPEAIAQKIAFVAKEKTWRPIVVLAIDGANVPTRPEKAKGLRPGRKHKRAKRTRWKGQWREAKGFRFYLVNGDRIVHLLSWHQVQTDQELAEALKQVQAAGLIPQSKVRLCVVADGAKWIWKHVKALFPSARQVLDYYHCCDHLHKVAALLFGEDPEKQTEWMEATLARLFFGDVQSLIEDLHTREPTDSQGAEEIRKLVGYLTNNQHRVDYGAARKGGYPIGSGGVESANKFISHVRLKRSGAWWYVEKANQILALRCAKYNGTFSTVFENYKEKQHTG